MLTRRRRDVGERKMLAKELQRNAMRSTGMPGHHHKAPPGGEEELDNNIRSWQEHDLQRMYWKKL